MVSAGRVIEIAKTMGNQTMITDFTCIISFISPEAICSAANDSNR